jgi:hypothetical protein
MVPGEIKYIWDVNNKHKHDICMLFANMYAIIFIRNITNIIDLIT